MEENCSQALSPLGTFMQDPFGGSFRSPLLYYRLPRLLPSSQFSFSTARRREEQRKAKQKKAGREMASLRFYLLLLAITTLTAALHLTDASGKEGLQRLLKKREVPATASGSASAAVVMPSSRAQQFLQSLRRPKRNLWDRNRPDVQQWIQQFMYMGFDEARLETDLAYWKDQSMSTDQGRQHHYDENAALGPRYPTGYRHGANVNYDYY